MSNLFEIQNILGVSIVTAPVAGSMTTSPRNDKSRTSVAVPGIMTTTVIPCRDLAPAFVDGALRTTTTICVPRYSLPSSLNKWSYDTYSQNDQARTPERVPQSRSTEKKPDTLQRPSLQEENNRLLEKERKESRRLEAELKQLEEKKRRESIRMEKLIEQQQQEEAAREAALEEQERRLRQLEEAAGLAMEKAAHLPQATLRRLFDSTPAMSLRGKNHVGFFGKTSVGKSTLINRCIGQKVCATGRAETTREIAPYRHPVWDITYWDIPGSNDKVSYMRTDVVGLLKGLRKVCVVVANTIGDMSKLIEMLEEVQIAYTVLVNKIDEVDSEEIPAFTRKILQEMQRAGYKHCRNIFFISASKQSGQWLEFVTSITN